MANSNELLKAIVSLLKAAPEIKVINPIEGEPDIAVGVYDFSPPESSYPYIEIDKIVETPSPNEPLQGDFTEFYFYLSVWSVQENKLQVTDILSQIKTRLDKVHFELPEGMYVSDCRVSDSGVQLDVDGKTYHGNATISIIVRS